MSYVICVTAGYVIYVNLHSKILQLADSANTKQSCFTLPKSSHCKLQDSTASEARKLGGHTLPMGSYGHYLGDTPTTTDTWGTSLYGKFMCQLSMGKHTLFHG